MALVVRPARPDDAAAIARVHVVTLENWAYGWDDARRLVEKSDN